MKSFSEALNEGRLAIGNMNFTIVPINDSKGLAVSFIPDGKTLDMSTKNEQVDAIQKVLIKKLPFLADALIFEIGNDSAGLVFRLDKYSLIEKIEKSLK
jgi:hypothetical protein